MYISRLLFDTFEENIKYVKKMLWVQQEIIMYKYTRTKKIICDWRYATLRLLGNNIYWHLPRQKWNIHMNTGRKEFLTENKSLK